jgi:hypothetical protein
MINPTHLPEQPKSKVTSHKPPVKNVSNKQTKNTNKVVVNGDDATIGVFMTMDEIAELVKAVKDTSKSNNNTTTESKGTIELNLRCQLSYVLYRRATSTTIPATIRASTTTTIQLCSVHSCSASIRFTPTGNAATISSNLTTRRRTGYDG